MYTLWVKNLKNKYFWFVLDETLSSIEKMLNDLAANHKGKKIMYSLKNATDDDINRYGGLSELYTAEHVIECCCLIDPNDDDLPDR